MEDVSLGTAFGELALEYERVRPGWPEEGIERVTTTLQIPREGPVADVGAGSGKLTRLLVERFGEVWAVEPDERMRGLLAASLPRVSTVDGTAEALPLADASLAAVFVGDAFHWFDAARAVSEISRVLRAGAGVVLLWNDWWEVEPALPERALALLAEPFVRSGRAAAEAQASSWREAFATEFTPFEELRIEWESVLRARDLVALYMTTSSFASLPDAERLQLRDRLLALVGGEYRLPVATRLYWATRNE